VKVQLRLVGAALVLAAAFAPGASAHAPKTIMIRHQLRGCHAWSFAGGPFTPSLRIRIDRDTALVVVDDDVMPHKLVQVSGPKAFVTTPSMRHMSARAVVTFRKAGVYRFTTKAGEDYMKGMKTIGRDNVLRLTVTVG
jgi:hypothetical protein